jgi:hypothetical protein
MHCSMGLSAWTVLIRVHADALTRLASRAAAYLQCCWFVVVKSAFGRKMWSNQDDQDDHLQSSHEQHEGLGGVRAGYARAGKHPRGDKTCVHFSTLWLGNSTALRSWSHRQLEQTALCDEVSGPPGCAEFHFPRDIRR